MTEETTLLPQNALDMLLCGARWYRRRRGGHWERWLLESGGAVWVRVRFCSRNTSPYRRPVLGSRGTPTCEDHRR